MQALSLRKRVGCTETDRKSWARSGILLARQSGSGAGVHAEYDDANLLAAAIANEMKRLGISVARYVAAFATLHDWLRVRSTLDWPRYRVYLTPAQAHFCRTTEPAGTAVIGVSFDLGPLCTRVFAADLTDGPQLQLRFGLEAVR